MQVHVVVYFHVNVVILKAEVGREPLRKLVCSLGVCRVDVLPYVINVVLVAEFEHPRGEVVLVEVVVEAYV